MPMCKFSIIFIIQYLVINLTVLELVFTIGYFINNVLSLEFF